MSPIVSDDYKRKRKEQILNSALICFAEKGFNSCTIDDIVAHSGLSKGSIYNYFKTKDDIYIDLMQSNSVEGNKILEEKLKEFHTAQDKLSYFFDNYLSIENNEKYKNITKVHIEFSIHSSRHAEIKKLLNERYQNFGLKIINKIITEGIERGEFKKDINPDEIGRLFWTFIDGISLHNCVFYDFPTKKIIIQAKQMFLLLLVK